MSDSCAHREQFGATVWPSSASLEHFDNCLTDAARLTHWEALREQADTGLRCLEANHQDRLNTGDGRLRALRTDLENVRKVNAQLREVTRDLERRLATARVDRDSVVDDVPDMSVTVTWPAERGQMQSAVYGRESAPDPETLTTLDRRIIRVLLEHALTQNTPPPPAAVVVKAMFG